jgi:hypothetical protein
MPPGVGGLLFSMGIPATRFMTRSVVRETIAAHLVGYEPVLALWEGGSAAFDRADAYSDLDLALLYRIGARDVIWKKIDGALDELGGVDLRWIDPKPFAKGGGKRIFHLRTTNPWLHIEITIIPHNAEHLYNQPERHGRIKVIFDRTGRLAPKPWDETAHLRRARLALHQSIMRWHLYYCWFRKELARGRTVDAFMTYYDRTLKPLLVVLNLRYRPHRWDFGLRYFNDELPQEIVSVVETFCYVPNPAGLEERFSAADRLLRTTVKELAERGLTPIDPTGFDIVPEFSS